MTRICHEAGSVMLGKGGRAERKGDAGQGNEGSREEPVVWSELRGGAVLSSLFAEDGCAPEQR